MKGKNGVRSFINILLYALFFLNKKQKVIGKRWQDRYELNLQAQFIILLRGVIQKDGVRSFINTLLYTLFFKLNKKQKVIGKRWQDR